MATKTSNTKPEWFQGRLDAPYRYNLDSCSFYSIAFIFALRGGISRENKVYTAIKVWRLFLQDHTATK